MPLALLPAAASASSLLRLTNAMRMKLQEEQSPKNAVLPTGGY